MLWPLQLRQQAVYACTVYKDPRYAKPHSSVLTTHCSGLSQWIGSLFCAGVVFVLWYKYLLTHTRGAARHAGGPQGVPECRVTW